MSGKKKTTMAKLTRERKLRERRLDKQAKKEARKLASAEQSELPEGGFVNEDEETDTTEGAGEERRAPLEA